MVAEQIYQMLTLSFCCSLAKISMVAELHDRDTNPDGGCSLAKISMVAEPNNNG